MSTAVIELITVFLKLVYAITSSIMKWKVEERNLFEKRMRTITKLLNEAISNKAEVINEKDFLSNLDWEKKERYKTYKRETLKILKQGGGISDLSKVKVMGMGLRVVNHSKEVLKIMLEKLDIEDKSIFIAKEII